MGLGSDKRGRGCGMGVGGERGRWTQHPCAKGNSTPCL